MIKGEDRIARSGSARRFTEENYSTDHQFRRYREMLHQILVRQ